MKSAGTVLALILLIAGAYPARTQGTANQHQREQPDSQKKADDSDKKASDEVKPLTPEERTQLPVPKVPTINPNPFPRKLLLKDVLLSVERHYPLLVAVMQERVIASGKALSAFGGFDTRLSGFIRQNQGSFDSQRYRGDFIQPTPFHGITFGGGWRLGSGIYPSYYQDRQTAVGGEFFGSVTMPLLKDRAIDSRRAGVRQALIDQQLAEPVIAQQRVGFVRDATRAYWTWVFTAQRFAIGETLLEIAEDRDEYLRKQAKAGRIAEIEITDNRRNIQDRRANLVRLQQAFEQASFDLSLFMRDDHGTPAQLARRELAPIFPPPRLPNPDELANGVNFALIQRPELFQLRLRIDKLKVRLALARNQTLPDLRLLVKHATDLGQEKSSLDRYAYEAGLLLEIPLQRRDARGRILSAKGELGQLLAREAFLRESITAEVQKAMAVIVRSYEVIQRLREVVRLAEIMERAELRRLELGQGNIFFVNLRELARADAQSAVLGALADYYRARADYRAVLGLAIPPKWLHHQPTQSKSKTQSSAPKKKAEPSSELLPRPRKQPAKPAGK